MAGLRRKKSILNGKTESWIQQSGGYHLNAGAETAVLNEEIDLSQVDLIVEPYLSKKEMVIPVLQKVQEHFGYCHAKQWSRFHCVCAYP
jgi:hypothetical protein